MRARRHFLLLAALLVSVLQPISPSALAATDAAAARVLGEKTAARLGDLRDLSDAKNYPAAFALADRLLADAPAGSYDLFVLSQVRAQLLVAQERYADAVAPLETSLALADAHPFLDARPKLDLLYLLAQLHAQLAATEKSLDAQRAGFDRAEAHLRRWLAETPSPTPEARLFAASVLYSRAEAGPADSVARRQGFADALAEAGRGLALSVHPAEQLYVLRLAALQQLGDLAAAADTLELLVEKFPDRAAYWSQLLGAHLNLAAAAPDDRAARPEWLRALLTLERAQQRGLLTAPADRYTLAALCHNLGQPARAVALLEAGLAGPLADDRRAWELLVRSHQLAHDDTLALAALERAAARFPTDEPFARALAQLRAQAGNH